MQVTEKENAPRTSLTAVEASSATAEHTAPDVPSGKVSPPGGGKWRREGRWVLHITPLSRDQCFKCETEMNVGMKDH